MMFKSTLLLVLSVVASDANAVTKIAIPLKNEQSLDVRLEAGVAQVKAYPEEVDASFTLRALPSIWPAPSVEACALLNNHLKLMNFALASASAKEKYYAEVRKDANVELAMPLLGSSEKTTLLRTINMWHPQLNVHHIQNPLTLESYELQLELSEDSMSRKFGKDKELESQISDLAKAYNPSTQTIRGLIHAQDLACDLSSGKASISLSLKGWYERPTVITSPMDVKKLKSLHEKLGRAEKELTHLTPAHRQLAAGFFLAQELKQLFPDMDYGFEKALNLYGAFYDAESAVLRGLESIDFDSLSAEGDSKLLMKPVEWRGGAELRLPSQGVS